MRQSPVWLSMAAVSLVLLVAEIAVAQTSQKTPQNTNNSSSATVEASQMVPAQAALSRAIDGRNAKPGDEFRARLAEKVHLKNGSELPEGTILMGKVGTDDMQQKGSSKLALCLNEAQLKNGKTIPIKATIVGVYSPDAGSALAPRGDQVANDWTRSIYAIDQIDALSGVDLHSRITSQNSGVLVSAKKDDIKLKQGTELALAIAPEGASAQSASSR